MGPFEIEVATAVRAALALRDAIYAAARQVDIQAPPQ
jgi:hypothetical protein